MNKFGDRLKFLRKKHDMTMDEFVLAINSKYPDAHLNKSIVSRYENNIHTPKRFTIVENIAEFFDVNINYVMGKSDNMYGDDIGHRKIPVLGVIACGIPILAQEDVQGYEYINSNVDVDFCLRCKGDSMIDARIFDGDIVYIHKQPDVENGEIAAVQIDGEEATLKRVYKINGSILLKPENPNYKEIIFSSKDKKNICILGKAIFFKSKVI